MWGTGAMLQRRAAFPFAGRLAARRTAGTGPRMISAAFSAAPAHGLWLRPTEMRASNDILSSHSPGKWEFWIDRGGTFTDIVGMDPRGKVRVVLPGGAEPEANPYPAPHTDHDRLSKSEDSMAQWGRR